jgi:hypothetical protein
MRKLFVLLAISLLSINVFGQEDVLFSNNGYLSFQNQEFFMLFVLVNDIEASVEAFKRPETPTIHETTTVKISEPISLFIVYSTDEDTINLTYNFRIREPNGSLSEIRFDGAKISDTVIKKKVLYPANAMPTIVFDEKEELGTYYFIVQVFNNNIYIRTFILEFNLLE